MKEIYLDNASNTKIDDRVLEVMLPYLKENYGNAQSMHSLGTKSKEGIEHAREQVADFIGAKSYEIYFTSCASEANNLAIKGVAGAFQPLEGKKKHIIVSAVEHFSVLYSAKRLSQLGFDVTYIPVDKYGSVSAEEIKKAIRPGETILVSVQHANPEIGTIQPIEEISKIIHYFNSQLSTNNSQQVLFHTDAVCTVGIIPVNVALLGVDLLTFSGTQFYGPKGAAVLYIKKGTKIIPQIDGGIQENGYRAGTENVPAIVGLGKACELAKSELEYNYKKMLELRNKLILELPKKIQYIYLNGHPKNRLPNNVNFSIEFIEGEGMMLLLDQKGIYVSSGSACASKALKMSHVLTAIKVDPAIGQGSVLMTLSKYNSEEEIDYVLQEFPSVVEKLRSMSPLYAYFLKTGVRKEAGPGTDFDHHNDEETE